MITITHTPANGTILEGTTRGDGTNHLLKPLTWRWSTNLGAWYLPRSRDTAPRTTVITDTTQHLRDAGHEVIVAIDGGHRDPAAVEADRADRQHDRAAALTEKADRHTTTALAAHQKARELGDQIPFGQPILVGHSENRMRRHANRVHPAIGTVAAAELAANTQRRAVVAANGTDAGTTPSPSPTASKGSPRTGTGSPGS